MDIIRKSGEIQTHSKKLLLFYDKVVFLLTFLQNFNDVLMVWILHVLANVVAAAIY